MLVGLMAWVTVALAGAPAPIALTNGESSQLAAGKVVVRPPSSSEMAALGVVDVAAPPEAVWAAVFDFPARVQETGALKRADVYATADDPGGLGVEFALTVFGTDIVFSTRYRCELAQGWCPYSLDAARPQDLVAVDGSYQTYASGDGTRLVYRSQTDSGRYVPGFVRRWLAVESLSKQLEGIKARAEAASGG
jgi:hypothetical protein